MYNRLAMFVAALALTATTVSAQTAVDVSGRIVRVDPGAQLIILDNNQAFRVTPNTVLMVNNQAVPIATLQPGQTVVIRSGEAVTLAPATTAQAPGTVVIAPGAPAVKQQTIYGSVTDVDRGEIKVRTDGGSFEVKVPPELAAQLRKGDNVRLDLTFLR